MPDLRNEHEASSRLLDEAVRETEARVRVAVAEALDRELPRLGGPNPGARAAEVSRSVGQALAGAVTQSRSAARRASDGALAREFEAAGGAPGSLPEGVGGDAEDERRGAAVGDSFAEALYVGLSAALAPGSEGPEAARRVLAAVVEERVPRIAATEAAHAFAAEREAVMVEHARRQRAAGLPVPTKVWLCRNRGECLVCFALCGTVKPWDEPWTTGLRPFVRVVVPGHVHPNCLCGQHVEGLGAPVVKRAVFWPEDLGRPRPRWARKL